MNDYKHYGDSPNPRAWPCIIKIVALIAVIGYMGERDYQQSKEIDRIRQAQEEVSKCRN